MMLLDFKQPDAVEGWAAIHSPQAMGGLGRTPHGIARFSGSVTALPEAAGYVSVVSPPLAWDLGGYNGLRLWVRGDGQRYGVILRDANWLGLRYRLNFITEVRQWMTVTLPFSAFKAVGIHRRLRWLFPRLNPARLRGWALIFEEPTSGPFEMEIEHVTAYRIEPFLARIPDDA